MYAKIKTLKFLDQFFQLVLFQKETDKIFELTSYRTYFISIASSVVGGTPQWIKE